MTRPDDRLSEMLESSQLDADIERMLRGGEAGDDLALLAPFVDDARTVAEGPPPAPSAELAALMAGRPAAQGANAEHGIPTEVAGRGGAGLLRRVAAMGLAGKAALCLVLAGAGVAGAGATGVLPDSADRFVRHIIEFVTPFDVSAGAAPPAPVTDRVHGAADSPPADAPSEIDTVRPSGPEAFTLDPEIVGDDRSSPEGLVGAQAPSDTERPSGPVAGADHGPEAEASGADPPVPNGGAVAGAGPTVDHTPPGGQSPGDSASSPASPGNPPPSGSGSGQGSPSGPPPGAGAGSGRPSPGGPPAEVGGGEGRPSPGGPPAEVGGGEGRPSRSGPPAGVGRSNASPSGQPPQGGAPQATSEDPYRGGPPGTATSIQTRR